MERSKTHIKELDDALFGGLPKNNNILLTGGPGTGKTVLSLQWIFNGIKKDKERGMYITATETQNKLRKNMEGFKFFDIEELEKGNMFIYDLKYIRSKKMKNKKIMESPSEIVDFIQKEVKKTKVTRLVIDSITSLCENMDTKGIRNFFWNLTESLNFMDCTSIFITEQFLTKKYIHTLSEIEEFISDGIISLEQIDKNNLLTRTLQIRKMRGTDHSISKFKLDILPKGISLIPLITED